MSTDRYADETGVSGRSPTYYQESRYADRVYSITGVKVK